jgi:hypothetical protein
VTLLPGRAPLNLAPTLSRPQISISQNTDYNKSKNSFSVKVDTAVSHCHLAVHLITVTNNGGRKNT